MVGTGFVIGLHVSMYSVPNRVIERLLLDHYIWQGRIYQYYVQARTFMQSSEVGRKRAGHVGASRFTKKKGEGKRREKFLNA
jgi:hypothetical protein